MRTLESAQADFVAAAERRPIGAASAASRSAAAAGPPIMSCPASLLRIGRLLRRGDILGLAGIESHA
jgi:hypothetical protein